MKWLEHLLRLKDRLGHSREPKPTGPVAISMTPPVETSPPVETTTPVKTRRSVMTDPPIDWGDIAGWDRYFETQFSDGPFRVPTAIGALGWQSVRFLSAVRKHGGRVWFPGCGIDPGPRFYAYVGSTVLATDFSPIAVHVQQKFAELAPEIMFADWSSFVKSNAPFEKCGHFEVAEHDFTTGPPTGVFDAVINCRAFQGLSPSAMNAAARTFFGALRPGGAAMIDEQMIERVAHDLALGGGAVTGQAAVAKRPVPVPAPAAVEQGKPIDLGEIDRYLAGLAKPS